MINTGFGTCGQIKFNMKKAILFLGLFLSVAVAASAQTLDPYLQAVTPTDIWISWKTSANTETIVEYGSTSAALTQTVNGSTSVFSDNGYPNNYFYHSAKLRNLQPNTKYYYRVRTGNLVSDVHSFRTSPLPGMAATAGKHVRFLIMGDNQIKSQPRFDSLVVRAKRKCTELYGPNFNDSVAMILMVGDQVDVGTLDHYENVHFSKCRYLSADLPINTIVGNHETYGTLQLNAYYNHFFYDSLQYGGIYSGNENWYAYQVGPVLIVNFSTEHVSGISAVQQLSWLQQILNKANTDPAVKWIMSFGHRPYQAEQYVGDISNWIRQNAVPLLATSPKFFMHTGAHHHLYARGQLKETPNYHIISGGTAWDQYWGMSTETDFDDVQKTLSNWPYQIVDFDIEKQRVEVKTYSVGSIYEWHENRQIDEFHRQFNLAAPNQPALNNLPDTLELPFVLQSTPFSTTTSELLNSTQFQVAQNKTFNVSEVNKLRDFENFFGSAGAPDTTKDLNAGVDILRYTLQSGSLTNGKYYARVRHRDRNLEWSKWSEIDSFVVVNSVLANPTIILDKTEYNLGDTIVIDYNNGPGLSTDWIGIYREGQTPGSVASTVWSYVQGSSGRLKFTLQASGNYYAVFFTNDSYSEISTRVPFFYGNLPELTSDKTAYNLGEPVTISYQNAPGLANDWIGLYKIGMTPGNVGSIQWSYTSGASGSKTFNNLPKGYYFASYFLLDGYDEIGERIFFSVGDTIAQLLIDKSQYNLGEYITATWTDGPGIPKDWLGIYEAWKNPNIDVLDSYTYIGGEPAGLKVLSDTLIPQNTGSYFIVLFTNDSYNEISNRAYFTVVDTSSAIPNIAVSINEGVKIFPNPGGANTIIESSYPIDKIEILSPEGRVVYRSATNAGNMRFNLLNQQLPRGVYWIKVYSRKLYTVKLVVE